MATQIDFKGGLRLKADAEGWTLYRLRIREKGQRKGEPYEEALSYHGPNLSQPLMAVLFRRLREADARSLQELGEIIRDFRSELDDLFEVANAPE